jgi:hypothetical protein
MAEHNKTEVAKTQVPIEMAEYSGTWAVAGTACTQEALAALMEAGVAVEVVGQPHRMALEMVAPSPLLTTTQS